MGVTHQQRNQKRFMETNRCLVLKKPFSGLVDTTIPADENAGFRQASSDSGIFRARSASDYFDVCQVEFELTGLSDAESDDDRAPVLLCHGHAANAGGAPCSCGSVTCSSCSSTCSIGASEREDEVGHESDSHQVLDLFKETPVYLRSTDSSPLSSPCIFPMYEPRGVDAPVNDVPPIFLPSAEAAPLVDQQLAVERMFSDNARLAEENELLRKNMRLASENQSLMDATNPPSRLQGCPPDRQTCGRSMQTWWVPSPMPGNFTQGNSWPSLTHAPTSGRSLKVAVASTDDCTFHGQGDGRSLSDDANSEADRTTVMWRNLPNNYTREMLLALINDAGFSGLYDYVYLPFDFKSCVCLGYAFINLVSPKVAAAFWRTFDGHSQWIIPSKKISSVNWSGPHQGLDAHVARYQNSPVMHSSVPDEHKPVIFANGIRIAHPAPTKTARAPRPRQRRNPNAEMVAKFYASETFRNSRKSMFESEGL